MKPKLFDTTQGSFFLAFAGFFATALHAAGLLQAPWEAGFFAMPAFPAFAGSGMNALGFELSTIFYGAFMRWYATLMPTATVFRFWDALLFQSTNPKTQSLGGRDYLIDLAFATLQVKRNELMECESAAEMPLNFKLWKGVVLGFLGSLYDTTTVIDLVHAADLYLWGGAGFSSGKVSYLWTQRDEMFKGINQTTKWQNQILHRLAFEGQVRLGTLMFCNVHIHF
eukprot:s292_g37.t1